ncbi:elongation factor P hydroxylase [Isoalcanivorax indicus]|uniref:elongation factor P hydroxylase n=1 Tax=Isoalcanivorax indicus TaxID=2202653 RepID=UPI000DBA6953|nr:elongation factor P hydroxylase [Isoalcanivorax indicus]
MIDKNRYSGPDSIAQPAVAAQARFDARDLERLFAQTFADSHDTLLCGGAEEPFYQPGRPHRILYTRDYFRSALHEVAHWCVAGAARRQLPDYGYWYAPDGRDAAQQRAFEQVEVKPQALELLFCEACGHPFAVSLDNLEGETGDATAFATAVAHQALHYRAQRRNQRWARWLHTLSGFYQPGKKLSG